MNMMNFRNFLMMKKIYHYNEIPEILKAIRPNFTIIKKTPQLKYFDIPCGFDIETTSFFHSSGKNTDCRALMYEWTFGIYGVIIIGRTWEEFISMLNDLSKELELNFHKRLIIYVHSLAFEFQFMRKYFEWEKVFAIDDRKPVYAISNGFEFRCSYILSGYSLDNLARNLQYKEFQKMVGDLDYKKIRTPKTPLTQKEIGYCVNDVKIVMEYIAEQIEENQYISNIPLTKTGFVRRYVKSKSKAYRKRVQKLTLTVDEYKQLKRAFQGGFTHCNPFYADKVLKNISSFDFTSSYPAVMISEQFPISNAEFFPEVDQPLFDESLKYYCCLFDVAFKGLRSKVFYDSYISVSRTRRGKNTVTNNGRVVQSDEIITTITEQDFTIIKAFYEWDDMKIMNLRRYKKDYLPKQFIEAILTLYEDKTKLKGIAGEEINYMRTKEMLNSCYGMIVTDICREEHEYNGSEWVENEDKTPIDYDKAIGEYNTKRGRFLFYPWGVWVTAYARRNLFTAICECKGDYVYSDTDSVKIRNAEKHKAYFDKYNKIITEKLYKTLDLYRIPRERINPETIKGEKKPLGVWDYEGKYTRFKSLGAKRYMTESESGEISLTVSGVNKKAAIPYLTEKYKNRVFDNFTNGLYIPKGYTGKMIHRYIDERKRGVLTDYKGIKYRYDVLSAIHLDEADYSLSLSREYADYILSL